MQKHGVKSSYLTCFAGTESVIEPSLYWHDKLGEFRLSLIEPEFQEKWKDIPADAATREVALRLRDGLRHNLSDRHRLLPPAARQVLSVPGDDGQRAAAPICCRA
jgi:hypothetical protein